MADDPCTVASLKLMAAGGESTYNPVTGQVIYTNRDSNGNYQLFAMRQDGSGSRLLTDKQQPGGPAQDRHKNAPSISPDGTCLLVQTEWACDPSLTHYAALGKSTIVSNGFHTDIWATDAAARQWWQLTDYASVPDYGAGDVRNAYGVLGPKFSPDGQHVIWSRMIGGADSAYAFGRWRLMTADYVVSNSGPVLANVRDITPPSTNWIEPGGFTPDSRQAVVSADTGLTDATVMDQWTVDLDTGQSAPILIDPLNWDEHGRMSPNGRVFTWMSSRAYAWTPGDIAGLKTEYELLDLTTGQIRQLTHFNQIGYPEFALEKRVVGGSDWQDAQHVWITTVWGGLRYPQRQLWLLTFRGACG